MTKQEAKHILNKWANKYSTELWKEDIEAFKVGIECIENQDILIDYIAEYDNQDIICDDLYGYDEVDEESWCSRNCKNFNRECVLKWLEYKRGVKND